MSKKKNIDAIFREKSLNFQKEPPPEIWDNILSGIQSEKRGILPIFWRIAAGIAIVIGVGLGYEYIFKTEPLEDNYFSQNETADSKGAEPSGLINTDSTEPFENVPEGIEFNTGEELSNLKDYSQDPLKSLPENNIPAVIASAKEMEEQIPVESNSIHKILTLINLPIQVKPFVAIQDSILKREFNIQYSWEDLVAHEDFIEKEGKDFLIEALLSPTYSYRDIVSSSPSLANYYNDFESGQLSYSGGMKVGFLASERLSIHTGIVYARIAYSIGGLKNLALKSNMSYDELANNDYISPQPIVIANSIGKISNDEFSSSTVSTIAQPENADASLEYISSGALLSPENRSVISDLSLSQIFHVMEIPFHMKYKLIDRKLDFNVLSGFSTNILVGNNLFVNEGSDRTSVGEIESVNKINYSGDFGLGLEYDISKKLQLLFEPQFKYYLNSINKDNLIANRPYSIGFYTGLSFIF